jgi:hypothetical protein
MVYTGLQHGQVFVARMLQLNGSLDNGSPQIDLGNDIMDHDARLGDLAFEPGLMRPGNGIGAVERVVLCWKSGRKKSARSSEYSGPGTKRVK